MPSPEVGVLNSWYKGFAGRAIRTIRDPGGSQAYHRAHAADQLDQLNRQAGEVDKATAAWIGRR